MPTKTHSLALRLVAGGSLWVSAMAAMTAPAYAQTAGASAAAPPPEANSGAQLAEIVVTANKRVQNLQTVPASAAAFGRADLATLRVTKVTDVANLVPGVQIISPNTGSDNFFSIRGVSQNDFSEHEESPVSLYLDDVYVSQAAATQSQLFDTDRVEVLRGPQGTLFGRNATGGLVQYFSKGPTADFTGDADLTVGSYDQVRFEGGVGGPVAKDLEMRIAVVENSAAGGLTNDLPGSGGHLNNQNDQGVRFQTLYQPTDNFQALLILRAGQSHIRSGFYDTLPAYEDPANHLLGTPVPSNVDIYGTCNGCDLAGYRNTSPFYQNESAYPGHNWVSTTGATLKLKYDIDGLNLVSVTDFTRSTKNYQENSITSPFDELHYIVNTGVDQISQDFHVDNGAKDRLRWVAGVYFLHIDGDYREDAILGTALGGPESFNDPYQVETTSFAPYAQAEYDIVRHLTLTVGARYTVDDKSLNYQSNILASEDPNATPFATFNFNQALYGKAATLDAGDWSGRVALDWQLADGIMPYVSWNRGLKAGGFNAPLTGFNPGDGPSLAPSTFKFYEETLDAFEAGIKTEFWDKKARINIDAFHYDYHHYQAFNFSGLTQLVFNTPATIDGGEVQATLMPLPGLKFDLGVALLDARASDVPLPDGTLAARMMAQSPRATVNGRAQYTADFSNGGSLTLETDFSYRTGIYYAISNAPSTYQGPLWLQNFHVNYTLPNKQWTAGVFVENAFDKHYFVNIVDMASLGAAQEVYGTPRWAGVELGYHF
jgi:iron complex outermembrane receptor protein